MPKDTDNTKNAKNIDIIYKELALDVKNNGELRQTRSGSVISKFSSHMKIDVSDKFPLLTTKKMYFKGIIGELIWFLNGRTDNALLRADNIHIWDGNSCREYLDKIGQTFREEWDCGPIYGYQWRHWNAPYAPYENAEYVKGGIDQLSKVIDLIINDPTSRRIVMSAWNVSQLDEMCLVPCHVLYQFYVSGDSNEFLSVQMYQRSADIFLGLPFNIASTATLLYIICSLTDKKPKEVSICIGDAHIYTDHLDALNEQLQNEPYELPTLKINKKERVEDLTYSDFILENYKSHQSIKAKMAQ